MVEQPKAVIKSRNRMNFDNIKVLDYFYDEENEEEDDIIILFVYKNAKYKQSIQDEVTDVYDIPTGIGDRYLVISNHVYFIDDATDIKGFFD